MLVLFSATDFSTAHTHTTPTRKKKSFQLQTPHLSTYSKIYYSKTIENINYWLINTPVGFPSCPHDNERKITKINISFFLFVFFIYFFIYTSKFGENIFFTTKKKKKIISFFTKFTGV